MEMDSRLIRDAENVDSWLCPVKASRCEHRRIGATTVRTYVIHPKSGYHMWFCKCEVCGRMTEPCFTTAEPQLRAERGWWK